jgi:hypothetical protein
MESEPLVIPDAALQELNVWRNFLLDKTEWNLICHPQHPPPICTKIFYSDAAGLPKNSVWTANIWCGVVGLDEGSDTCLAYQL